MDGGGGGERGEKEYCKILWCCKRPLLSSKYPHFQNEATCKTFLVNKEKLNHFQGCAHLENCYSLLVHNEQRGGVTCPVVP